MTNNNSYAIIMAGGIGSRFWPMSRTAYPKQFLDILNSGLSLLQATYNRFLNFIPNEKIFIITAEEYVGIVKEQLPQLPAENIVGEPERRNTAACILYMSYKIKLINPDAKLIVAPSDHLIEEDDKFEADCIKALDFVSDNEAFVTLGITPHYANTGYGYIQSGNKISPGEIRKVIRFTEKPDKPTAVEFVNSGNYLWNSGIFIWKAEDIVTAFREFMPEMYQVFSEGLNYFNTSFEKLSVNIIYRQCESISVDYAILEKANNVFVIPAEFSWSDLGTWNSAWENSEKDTAGNAVSGSNTFVVDSNGCIVHSTDKKLVLVGGVEDLIVVNTPDAIMICNKGNEQQIKEYIALVGESKGTIYL